jgi:hypothetical protein
MLEVNEALCQLWLDHHVAQHERPYAPMQYETPHQNGLLFVGLNPSFSDKGWKTLLPHIGIDGFDPYQFFGWPRPDNFNMEVAYKVERVARERYQFFAPHRALAEAVGMQWDHIDLFAYRMTAQKDAMHLFVEKGNAVKPTRFGQQQLGLLEKMLAAARPRAVIVVNSLASRIYQHLRNPGFDSKKGCYLDTITGHPFPVFYSGMITGGGMDVHSRERLFWQIVTELGVEWKPGMASIKKSN